MHLSLARKNGGDNCGDAKSGQREQVAKAKKSVGLRQRRLPRPIEDEGCGKCHGGTGCKHRGCFDELH
ncbi:hypothetical protein E6C76_21690 [Pseudothauera nasutitermitis]|uniref:Uncharacterized protein n=1 Tax=Pseudothauera nasutitermitis TaxID=2565930 RepID=A0A4S4AMJ5_9RHOO|nr:hypothetical protein [Pseudothauera nasutitermitis]THF60794.1 hypothetical protein E6C76_21690 [Pseudothauera nasutitermitis]